MESETLVFGSVEPIKSIEVKEGKATVGAYAIRFSGPDQKDLTGEYFTAKTYLGSHHGDGADVLFNHGFAWDNAFGEICAKVFATAKATLDEVGVFVQHTLELADEYEAAIAKLVEAGKLKWSSGTASHLAKKSATGEITRWPIAEFSYTPTPAEPRLPAIAPLKSVVIDEHSAAEIAAILRPEKTPEKKRKAPVEGNIDYPENPPVDKAPEADAPINQIMDDPEIQEKIAAGIKAGIEQVQKEEEKRAAAVKARIDEVKEIYAIGERFGRKGDAERFVEENKSVHEFLRFIVERISVKGLQPLSLIPEPDTKTMKRRDFDALTVGQRMEFLKSRGKITD
jgi:hypothetical protein